MDNILFKKKKKNAKQGKIQPQTALLIAKQPSPQSDSNTIYLFF